MLEKRDLEILEDQEFLKAKKRIIEDITSILQKSEQVLKTFIRSHGFAFPDRTFARAGKISKGENYQDLPYLILDFPRKFSKPSTFAYRTMVWWGNEISFTMHLGGDVLELYYPTIINSLDQLKNYYLSIHESPWEYHYGTDNYRKISSLTFDQIHTILNEKDFVKISIPHPLKDIKKVPELALEHFKNYLSILNI